MHQRIVCLPPEVFNQIAAGEVIERPASVVKELLENAADAGASKIVIDIGHGGLNLIRISDDGSGIEEDDLPLAVTAHATSKIKALDDLYSLNTMGFRGEALASIAAVANVSIKTKTQNASHASELRFVDGKIVIEPCARTTGTTVEVRDLFEQAPVRKRFLKGERVEFQAIDQVVRRFAMSRPDLAITLNHQDRVILKLNASRDENAMNARLKKIFGTAFVSDAISIHATTNAMEVSGFISGLSCQRSQNDRQWFYINQRMVKDKLLLQVLRQVYEPLLHPGRHASCLLYLTIDTQVIDVNVHPAKSEVRFQEPRMVRDFLIQTLTNALKQTSDLQEDIKHSVAYLKEPGVHEKIYQRYINDSHQSHGFLSLNSRFALLQTTSPPLIVDVGALYRHWLYQELKKHDLPLKARPLLVPVPFECDDSLIQDMARFGLNIQANNGQTYLESIPCIMPQIDLALLQKQLGTHCPKNDSEWFDCLIDAHNPSLSVLSEDIKTALALMAPTIKEVAAVLDEQQCQRLFYA